MLNSIHHFKQTSKEALWLSSIYILKTNHLRHEKSTRSNMPITRQYLLERSAWLYPSMVCKEASCPQSDTHIHYSTACNSPVCPIKHFHLRGRYLHDGKFANQRWWPNSCEGGWWNNIWGSNNPPPEIWLAYFRIRASLGTEEDDALVQNFVVSHMFVDLSGRGRGDLC